MVKLFEPGSFVSLGSAGMLRSWPSLYHWTVGVGLPLTLQKRVTFCPSSLVVLDGCVMIEALSEIIIVIIIIMMLMIIITLP
jgi:hypothetical protein